MNALITYEKEVLKDNQLIVVPGGARSLKLIEEVEPESLIQVGGENVLRLLPRDEFKEEFSLIDKNMRVDNYSEGWVAYFEWRVPNGDRLLSLSTTWKVPPEPSSANDQTIYLFNGLQSTGSQYSILQPVLQWQKDEDTGSQAWAIASWCVTSDRRAKHTPFIQVFPGEELTGIIRFVKKEGQFYLYIVEFANRPGTRMIVKSEKELVLVFEALEVYNIRSCRHYPDTNKTIFSKVEVKTMLNRSVRWEERDRTNDCGVGCRQDANKNLIFFYQ